MYEEQYNENQGSAWQSDSAQQAGQAQQSQGSAWQSDSAQQAGQTQQSQGSAWQSNYSQQSNGQQTWHTSEQQAWKAQGEPVSGHRRSRKERKASSHGFGAGKAVAIALCCSLLGGVVGAGGVLLGSNYLNSREVSGNSTVIMQGSRPKSAIQVANIDTSKVMNAAEVYAANVNSTVGITTSITTNYWGYVTTTPASGSGFILTEDGYIVTNEHVIEDASTIQVTTYDGTSYDAELIGYDESNDVAVLKIDAQGLSPVVLGDSDSANVGDSVVAIGNPLGELTFSLSSGAISALDRSVTFSTGTTLDLMQVDCAINAGNSGGPLFNMYGEVIGITNAKYSNNGQSSQASIENIGFAIPINNVRGIIESLIKNGYISKPYIGVSINDVSSQLQAYGIPQGAAVVSIVENSPAEKAGLRANDIITRINDVEITKAQDLVDYVGKAAIGDELVMTVYRQGGTTEITVVVEENKQSGLAREEKAQQEQQSQEQESDLFRFPWFGF